MSELKQNHEIFMRRALDLAKRGSGKVEPNPMVGAVLVKNGKIIAEGYHKKFGGPHAEVNALKKVTQSQLHDATLYVSLEPCCYFGKTPPCTNFLIDKGIGRLVVAMRDPNPLVAGKGISILKKNGVSVLTGILEADAQELNRVFVKNKMTNLPFLSIKLGTTLDGKISTLGRQSYNITNDQSRKQVHKLRANVGAILTTSATVIADDPQLTVRMVKGKNPFRVVIDSGLRTNVNSRVYQDKNVLVATTAAAPLKNREIFQKKGIELLIYKGTNVPLKLLLKDLYKRGFCHVMTEAGSGLVTSLVKMQLADELILFIAPKILGKGLSWVDDLGIGHLERLLKLGNVQTKRFGEDVMISGRFEYQV